MMLAAPSTGSLMSAAIGVAPAPASFDGLVEARSIAVGRDDTGPHTGEPDHDLAAHPARCAGDDHHLSREVVA